MQFFSNLLVISFFLLLSFGCKHTDRDVTYFNAIEEDIKDFSEPDFEDINPDLSIKPEWLEPNKASYRLGVGDQLEIEILGVGGTLTRTFIMPDGRVYFDLAGGVKAEGMTLGQLGVALKEALVEEYTEPEINVTLKEVRSRRAWVLGRVSRPGLYPLSQPTTVLEAIAMAGGLFSSRMSGSTEELADLGSSFILRKGKLLPINFLKLLKEGDMSQNIYLRDGDYIYVPSASSQSVNVLGAVRLPRAVGFKDNITLVEAIAKAFGPLSVARLDHVVIIRGSITEPRVAVVDFKAILAGQAKNVQLRSFDVVYVPDRPLQRFRDYFWLIMNSAAQTVAVREGANSVEGADGSPSLSIPISSSTGF
jgi:protein involved in polysaccharide export with SLBB domain